MSGSTVGRSRAVSHLTALLGAIVLAALLAVPSALPQSTTPFAVGFAEDLPKEIGTAATDPARALGATAFRLTTQWSPGQTQLDEGEATRPGRCSRVGAPNHPLRLRWGGDCGTPRCRFSQHIQERVLTLTGKRKARRHLTHKPGQPLPHLDRRHLSLGVASIIDLLNDDR